MSSSEILRSLDCCLLQTYSERLSFLPSEVKQSAATAGLLEEGIHRLYRNYGIKQIFYAV